MEESVSIREIRLEDTQAIQDIRIAISDEDAVVDFQKLVEQHVSIAGGKTSLLAEVDGQVVAYMLSTTLYAGFGIGKSAWIVSFGVHPDYMGKGLGIKLADRIFAIYKEDGVKSIYSSVVWDSIDLLSFFKKLGFKRSEFINLKKDL
ncbi:MAG: GNAT family N-acetyltransferase [Desulfobacteraceae bacterium]|nr:GNAT family N-acetyltransferase [Desulfobacteraceae bacterium]